MSAPIIATIAAFFIMIFGGAGIFIAYIMTQRQKNAAKAENHVWISIIPKAGKEHNHRVPIEIIGGVPACRVPDTQGKSNEFSPIHILGEPGEFQADYPPGKMKFVQTPMTKLIYYEGDAEPLSNIDNLPVISGQVIANIINGATTAAAEVIRRSNEESGGMKGNTSKIQIFVVIGLGLVVILNIVGIVLSAKGHGGVQMTIDQFNTIKAALGIP